MWSQFLLCLLVGLSYARQAPAWKENTEYTYDVHGRSLTGIDGISQHYSGIVLRAKLIVQPQGTDRLRLKIVEPEYADVTADLVDGWMSNLPENQLNYQHLEITDEPFEVVLKNGVIRDFIVNKDITEREANFMKACVSQLQMDTSGENLVHSQLNILPKEGSNNAVFKVLEDTVTGITETVYDIHPMPEYILQSKPYLAPFPHLKGDGSIIEVVKSKNYTKGHDLPSYFYGLGHTGKWKPLSNQFAHISQRSSLGRAIITGTLQRYTIQFSETINKVVCSLGHVDQDKGSVNSMMRIKLTNAEQPHSQLPELSSPISLGSLVYSYNKQSETVNAGRIFQREDYHQYDQHSSESHEELPNNLYKRHPRSLDRVLGQGRRDSSEESIESQEDWTVPKARLTEAPKFPLLPFTVGYKGKAIKYAPGMQIVDKVYSLAQKIGQELQHAKDITKKYTLSKFVLLTSVLRIMDENEIKQVAERLYTQETDTPKYYAWIAFRDSVAEAGTGPAFLVIKYLLESGKVQHYEATYLLVTMGQSCRQPTEEYVRAYFDLVKKYLNPQQEVHSMLNETMLFSFSRLVSRVFVNDRFSHREYPSHSFGKFDTKEGKTFVRKEFIPYLAKQLREAITNGDSQRIHAYIRALGEVGDREIIYILQPYLEGKIHCSQFQRFAMVLALKKVSKIESKLIAPILYRIYQNIGETTEIRVASVYMLMHTNPSSTMLQRIAQYTHLDDNHKVCAAVKLAIESLSQLKGIEFSELRSAAESARYYLNKKEFAAQDPVQLLVTYASSNWEEYYKGILQTFVGEDTGLPTSFYFNFQGSESGYKSMTVSLESLVSDIRNLFHVFEHQTEWYKQKQDEQSSSQQSEKSNWSSHSIAHMLNLQTDELEQLEGGIFMQMGEIQKHFFFDNHTLERLPQVLEELFSSLEQGKKIRYIKLINNRDGAIAFPTEIGFPFVFTYDNPIFMKLEGTVKGQTQPKISNGHKLITLDNFELQAEMKVTFSAKSNYEFGMFSPFNHYHYSAGFDRNVHVDLPVKAQLKFDFKTKKFEYELEPLEADKDYPIFHRSSVPYVSKRDILTLQTTTEGKYNHVIRRRMQNQWEHIYGDKAVGMAFRVKYENDYKYPSIYSMLRGNIFGSYVQYEQFNVEYLSGKSQNKKFYFSFSYDMKRNMESKQETPRKVLLKKMFELPVEANRRVTELTANAATGIYDATAHAFDVRVEFRGKQNVQYIGSLGYANNQIASKSRMLFSVKKLSQVPGSMPFEGAVSAKFNTVPMSGLDMEYVLQKDIKSSVDIDFAFGEKKPLEKQGEIHTTFSRTDSRKEYLMDLPLYHKCQKQIQQGNQQLFACANMTQMAGLFDYVKIDLKYPNLHKQDVLNILNKYNALYWGPFYYFNIEENKQPKQKQGEVTVALKFYPDLERFNVSVATQEKYAYIKNIPLNDWTRRAFVVHPVFSFYDRVEGKLLGYHTYKPICSLDKTKAYTFDGTEYPLSLKPYWTVALQYVPQRSYGSSHYSVEEQLKREIENYVVLVRQSGQSSDQREVKISVSTPKTNGKVLEVTLKPTASGNYPQVFVDGTVYPLNNVEQSKTYKEQVSVSALANGEVLVRVHDAFYVIYDGTRVKITPQNILKLRNRVRGICGNFEGRTSNDFVTPRNCIVRDANEYIASYTVMKEGERNQEIIDLKSRSQNNHCVYKKVPIYARYIQSKDEIAPSTQSRSCSRHQTRYAVEGGQICFSIRPLTACRDGCRKQGSVYKNVEVHCVENRNVATLWKSQIDKGASPDFSQKPVTKLMQVEVPQSCISM